MNTEKLLQRKAQLEQERDQLKATLSAYDGAIQDCNYWLTQLENDVEDNTDKSE